MFRSRSLLIFHLVPTLLLLLLIGCANTTSSQNTPEDSLEQQSETSKSHWPQIFRPTQVSTSGVKLMTVFGDRLVACGVSGLDESMGIDQIASWDGSRWWPMGTLPKCMKIAAMAEHHEQLVIGGKGDCIDCDNAQLASWDGTHWSLFGQEIHGVVKALTSWNDLLVVGGQFWIEGHPEMSNLVAWDGNSWIALSTDGLGGGANRIQAMTVHKGNLVVGGIFAEVDGVASINVARYDGSQWHDLAGGVDGQVTHLTSLKGQLYVAGDFGLAGGEHHPALASWDGKRWHDVGGAFHGGVEPRNFSPLYSMKAREGKLWVCGNFCGLGGTPADAVAWWDGQNWHEAAGPLGSGDEEWFRRKLESGNAYPSIHEVEIFRGRIVAFAPDNQSFPYVPGGSYFSGLITWTGDRWQGLDWPNHGFINKWAKIREYQGELIAGSRVEKSSYPLEVWRGSGWESLVDFPDDLPAETVTVRQMEVMGNDLYIFALLDNGKKSSLVLHYDGRTLKQLGQALPDLMGRESRLTRSGDRLVLIGRKVKPNGRQLEPLSTVLEWTGTIWKPVENIPELHHVPDALGTSQGCFVASVEEVRVEGRRSLLPTIWLWRGDQWEKTWSHSSGMISFLQEEGGQVRAGIGEALLDSSTPTPILQWDGQNWQPMGEPLAGFVYQKKSAPVHSLALYRNKLLLSCTTLDMAIEGDSPQFRSKVLTWDNEVWNEVTDLDRPVAGMLVQGDRLWFSEGRGSGKIPLPLTWYEGEAASSTPFARGQMDLWRAYARDRKKDPDDDSYKAAWESAPSAISLPGVPDSTPLGGGPEARQAYRKGALGWFGHRFENASVEIEEVISEPEGSLTSHLRRYQTLGVNFPGEKGACYQVTFDFSVRKNGQPWFGKLGQPVNVRLNSSNGNQLLDSVSLNLRPEMISWGAEGTTRISMMVAVPVDSAHVRLEFQSAPRRKTWDVAVENLKIQKTTIPMVSHFDQLTGFLTTGYRDFRGRRVPADSLKAELRVKAAAAVTNQELNKVIQEQLTDLRMRGLMDTFDQVLRVGDRDADKRLADRRSAIDNLLINRDSSRSSLGFLPNKTVYFRLIHGSAWDALLKEEGTFSLRMFPAGTRVVLDLRRSSRDLVSTRDYGEPAEVVRWKRAWQLGAAFVSEPRELCSFRGEEGFLNAPEFSDHLEEADEAGWRKLMVRPENSLEACGEIIVLINQGSEIPMVLALKGAPGVTVIGSPARRLSRAMTGVSLTNGQEFRLPIGEFQTADGKNPLVEGVAPDILVDDEQQGDPAFAKARELLGISSDSSR